MSEDNENNEVALNNDKEESEQIAEPEQQETENEPEQDVRILILHYPLFPYRF